MHDAVRLSCQVLQFTIKSWPNHLSDLQVVLRGCAAVLLSRELPPQHIAIRARGRQLLGGALKLAAEPVRVALCAHRCRGLRGQLFPRGRDLDGSLRELTARQPVD